MAFKKGVIPVPELKSHSKQVLEKVMRTGEPTLITQNGHSAVMIVDVESYQSQQKKLHLLELISKGEREILQGRGIPHSDAVKKIRAWSS